MLLVQGSLLENYWSMRSPKSRVHTCTQNDSRQVNTRTVMYIFSCVFKKYHLPKKFMI